MTQFVPQDPNFLQRVRQSFAKQQAMRTIGAELLSIEPGLVELTLPYDVTLTQQHGFLHAGIAATVMDSACGYAAFTLMPAQAQVLSIEFKVNLLAPATGTKFIARGAVKKAGRTISVTEGELYASIAGEQKLVATMTATMMTILDRDDVSD